MKKTPEDTILLHMCTMNEDHMMHGFWDMECDRYNFLILDYFLPFDPPNNPKNENFEKMRIAPRDITTLHLCTTHDDHVMHSSWNIKCYIYFFLPFNTFTPLQPRKSKFWKKMRNSPGNNIILHKYTINDNHIRNGFWDMAHDKKNHFELLFALLKKISRDIIILHKCTKNHDYMLYCSWDMACDECNFYFSLWAIFSLLPL